jgi:MFS transporter, MFS domain-containing protein family, molybdate-anion transporter
MEHIPSMPILLFGRVLGGLSTSLLFCAFESWMVSEHRRLQFHEDLLASTFSIASAGNGVMAISAGFLAQVAAGKLTISNRFVSHFLITNVYLIKIYRSKR